MRGASGGADPSGLGGAAADAQATSSSRPDADESEDGSFDVSRRRIDSATLASFHKRRDGDSQSFARKNTSFHRRIQGKSGRSIATITPEMRQHIEQIYAAKPKDEADQTDAAAAAAAAAEAEATAAKRAAEAAAQRRKKEGNQQDGKVMRHARFRENTAAKLFSERGTEEQFAAQAKEYQRQLRANDRQKQLRAIILGID